MGKIFNIIILSISTLLYIILLITCIIGLIYSLNFHSSPIGKAYTACRENCNKKEYVDFCETKSCFESCRNELENAEKN